jgi:hypothetical protein
VYLWSQYAVYIFGGIALITGKVVNDRQTEKIETLRNENLKLQRLIHEPRTIDEQLAGEILDANEKGTLKINFVTIGNEPEKLARVLSELLTKHGWIVASVNPVIVTGMSPGITVALSREDAKPGDEFPSLVKTLQKLLTEAVRDNPGVSAISDSGLPRNSPVTVTVATKY